MGKTYKTGAVAPDRKRGWLNLGFRDSAAIITKAFEKGLLDTSKKVTTWDERHPRKKRRPAQRGRRR